MTTRRQFLLATPAAAMFAAPTFANAVNRAAPSPASEAALQSLMGDYLGRILDDPATAATLSRSLFEVGFDWRYPTIRAREANSVIAYSFGNRLRAGRTETEATQLAEQDVYEPGPVNTLLADTVHAVRGDRKIPIYAQWEIAQILDRKYGMKDVVAIRSDKDAQGKTVYLSTEGVAKAVVRHSGLPGALGKAAIVGHRDHVKRCIMVSKNMGIDAAAVAEISLPTMYDAKSGQAWTRRRDVYLIGDVLAQLVMERSRLLNEIGS